MIPEKPQPIPSDAIEAATALRNQLSSAGTPFTVGIGFKQTGGEFTDRIALFVYVPRKMPLPDVPEHEVVPAEFGGYETDVVEINPALIDDESRYDPLCGGIHISRQYLLQDGIFVPRAGTLGAVVRNRATGQHQLLTCAHVARSTGLSVFQPGQGLPFSSIIGTVADLRDTQNPLLLDCAVITPNGSRPLQAAMAGIGPVQGAAVQLPLLGEMVKKRGMRTGLTEGFVVRYIASSATPVFDQFHISGAIPLVSVFAGHGDSGSVVLNTGNQVVGLLYAIPSEDLGGGMSSSGLAMPIHNVLEALGVDIAT
ncbi:hypothetical protein BVC93_01665 [Mycobacterium sp. MS1601]|nr:hypothetical protein BVC93_01665 [Mycobacterium sp. MS1601]